MNDSPEQVPMEYGIYVPSEAEAMTKLLADVFTRHDPPAVAAGLTPAEFKPFVQTLLPRAAEEGLTIVARLPETGEMVGALLTNDPACESAGGMETLSEKFGPIASILGQLITEYRAGQEPREGEMLHLYLLGVSDRVAGKGVGQRLVATCIENGARRGYRLAVAEATNKTSQHIFRKQGFVPRAQVSYRDHIFGGRRAFQSIAEHGGPILMEKVIALPDSFDSGARQGGSADA